MSWNAKILNFRSLRLAFCVLVVLAGVLQSLRAPDADTTSMEILSSHRVIRHNVLNVAEGSSEVLGATIPQTPVRVHEFPDDGLRQFRNHESLPAIAPPRRLLLRLKLGSGNSAEPDILS